MPIFANIPAESLWTLPARLGEIFYFIVLPILLLAAIGWLIQRKMGLDMPTLLRLNFYFVMPGMTYFAMVSSTATPADVGMAVMFSLVILVCLAGVTLALARARNVPRDHRNALLMTTMFYNSGNYGAPLQKLAFQDQGRGDEAFFLQTFVMITQNVTNFTIGVWLAATRRGQIHWKQSLMNSLKFPPLYSLVAGLLTIWAKDALGGRAESVVQALRPFCDVLVYVKDAFIGVALCTLGAQLALVSHGEHSYPIKLSVVTRLLIAPLLGLALIYAFGLSGFLAQVLLISSCTPTAVNVMLLCMQFDNHPEFAARAVFYSTLLSPVTMTLVICLAKGGFLARLAGS